MGRFQTQSFSCPQDASSSWHSRVIEYCQPRSSPELWCPEFLLAFHCVGLIDCLALQFPDLADIVWSESHLINLNCQVWQRSPLNNKDILSLGKFEGLEVISQEPGIKVRTSFGQGQILYNTSFPVALLCFSNVFSYLPHRL